MHDVVTMERAGVRAVAVASEEFADQGVYQGGALGLKEARKLIDESGYDISLQIDGGVSAANIKEIAEAGVDMFVAGSAIFNQPDYKKVIDDMRSELAQVPVPGKK